MLRLFFLWTSDINLINSGKITTNHFRSSLFYVTNLIPCWAVELQNHSLKNLARFQSQLYKNFTYRCWYAKRFKLSQEKSLWWDFWIMPLRLSSHFNDAQIVVPRNFRLSPFLMSWPLIINCKTAFDLRWKSNTISLVF